MPNLKPPVSTVADAAAYRQRILAACRRTAFEPLMTLYLTDNTARGNPPGAGKRLRARREVLPGRAPPPTPIPA